MTVMDKKTIFFILLFLWSSFLWANSATTILKNNEENESKIKHSNLSNYQHYDGDHHNTEYDHEAFLGEDAKTFDQLSPDESRRRLGSIVDKIDSDSDGYVSHPELKDWIRYTQQKYVRDNVERTWKSFNPNNKERIGWEEYSDQVYGFMKDMSPSELSREENGVSHRNMFDRDRRRWSVADLSGDDQLTKEEFTAFLHPEETPRMMDLLVVETVEDVDKDKDGKVSLEEYIGDTYQKDSDEDEMPDWVKNEIAHFSKDRDKDGDGFLNEEEVKNWISPVDYDQADAEARHLIYEADRNSDNKLTKTEIVDKYDLFVGSQATDFGEVLMRHDEF
uniref:Reticulocalbin-3 n=1 Tax=Panstrongylus lignarius TaxID=156445 RepID=A0A224XN57_9HEMI